MSDTVNESELGRSKQSASPGEHLLHLLNIGWSPTSPLILKYVADNHLQRQLADWQAVNEQAQKARSK